MTREAMLYEKRDDNKVVCALCAHRCVISPSRRGLCGVRENRDGTLHTLVYGSVTAENIDPIEKKPIFHVYPGSKSLSIATVGCNFRCTFCQNHDISQMPVETGRIAGRDRTPEAIVKSARTFNCKTIAYTYTEPTIFFEFAFETARLAHELHIKNIFVTNGFMTSEALNAMAPYLDAANVDLKSFDDAFYRNYCGARLEPVLQSLKAMKKLGVWLEITTLIIPTLNDSDKELRAISAFIASLGVETPWHISRFHPQYKMSHLPPTPLSTIHRAVEAGKEAGLRYVYTGNVPGDKGENTYCHNCGERLIERYGFHVNTSNLIAGRCPKCDTETAGIFDRQ